MINPIGKSNIVHTPESMADSESRINESYRGETKAAAFLTMMMTWNLAHDYVEAAISEADLMTDDQARALDLVRRDRLRIVRGLSMGGSFADGLSQALKNADSWNIKTLAKAWPELILKADRLTEGES